MKKLKFPVGTAVRTRDGHPGPIHHGTIVGYALVNYGGTETIVAHVRCTDDKVRVIYPTDLTEEGPTQ